MGSLTLGMHSTVSGLKNGGGGSVHRDHSYAQDLRWKGDRNICTLHYSRSRAAQQIIQLWDSHRTQPNFKREIKPKPNTTFPLRWPSFKFSWCRQTTLKISPVAVLSLISSSFINVADVICSRSSPLSDWKNSTIALIVFCKKNFKTQQVIC